MREALWEGVELELWRSPVLPGVDGEDAGAELRLDTARHHPSFGVPLTQWQPEFYYYLDAFLGAARSVPDIIQKCFGWDKLSKNNGRDLFSLTSVHAGPHSRANSSRFLATSTNRFSPA